MNKNIQTKLKKTGQKNPKICDYAEIYMISSNTATEP